MKLHWERILQNKYNHLLTIEIIILVAYPLLQSVEGKFPIIPLLLLVAVAPALWVGLSRKAFAAVISIGAIGFCLNVLFHFGMQEYEKKIILALLFLYTVFFFLAIAILMNKISSRKVVSADTIKGGISIYFLLGLLWAMLYMIMGTFDKNAFSKTLTSFDCYYYSFTTLTTLGYGDIAPVAKYAKILAIMEAVTGPVYLAIFVAQLIGINIAQKLKD